jgi:hypothetical protein
MLQYYQHFNKNNMDSFVTETRILKFKFSVIEKVSTSKPDQ